MPNLKNSNSLKKILIVRNDKLGDLLVSFSAFAILKENLPETEIHVLVSNYTAPIAKMCEFIDNVIIDPFSLANPPHNIRDSLALIHILKGQKYDAIISLFSCFHVGLAALLSKIPIRVTPATKLAQLFYNHRLPQHRSQSKQPEHAYNKDLAEYLLSLFKVSPIKEASPPFMSFEHSNIDQLKQQFMQENNIASNSLLIFMHPGSGGSAGNISPLQFAALANQLHSKQAITIVISFAPNEDKTAKEAYAKIARDKVLYESNEGLEKFCQHLSFADCFISGSTGPLHIAGVLDRPTAAFYTRRRSATSLRWQTLNSEPNRLAFSPPESSEPEDMSTIDITQAAKKISEHFLQK